ncbi:MAG TPA: protein translocase subunit SecD [Mycobacteriales bacterium]|nr:protein translocase subunit SecD [Mycobacteriales bacterium]
MAPSGQLRVGRYIAVLLAILVALYALVFFTGDRKLAPRLGLDLIGGTTVTLSAKTSTGQPPSAESLETARQIIENRVNGLGVAEAEVVTEGNTNIVVSVPGQDNEDVKRIGAAAQMRFRQVVKTAPDVPAAEPAATPTPSGSATPSPSGSATPSASGSATPSASGSATPSASRADALTPPTLAEVTAKLGGRSALATLTTLTDPAQLADGRAAPLVAALEKLTPAEIAVLPAAVQFNVPQITCAKLNARPPGSISAPDRQVTACDDTTKYLLDKAAVLGTDVSSANYQFDASRAQWIVTLNFKGNGQDKWTNLTRKAFNEQDQDRKRVAIVLDNDVVSAPEIQGVITGQAEITGGFNEQSAKDLATKLKYGALPLTFEQQTAQTISPTLGLAQLEAGLLAGAVGLALVLVYVLFYYRLLGIVTIASLLLSGLVVYAVLILLGRPNTIGFTLTLAGIAGFIVSVGITADSFVVFFERLKDEIREGRSARSAVPRAWVRARRTIISADTVSFLAAAVLYVIAAGAVKGFAFTLGMSTVLDLVVVFLFTHPVVALLSRSKAFMSPRISGLGRVAAQAAADTEAAARRATTKEA